MRKPREQNNLEVIPFYWADFLEKLRCGFPEFRFIRGKKFAFRPPKTIVVNTNEEEGPVLALHELGHATLGHRFYGTDIERVKMEAEAWEKAKELADLYGVEVNEELIQDELDTYREWLHKKSRCPECGQTRFQTPDGVYHCPGCDLI